MKEIWKDVIGYEDNYEASNMGNVKGKNRKAKVCGGRYRLVVGKLLRPTKRKDGYLVVTLSKDGSTKTELVHRLVAKAFLRNPDNLPEVNHKNEVRNDNRTENLEWCDKSYNQLYSLNLHPERVQIFGDNFKDPTTGESLSPYTKAVPHKWFRGILQKSMDGKTIMVYENTSDLMNKTKFDSGLITKVCNGQHKTAYGYL